MTADRRQIAREDLVPGQRLHDQYRFFISRFRGKCRAKSTHAPTQLRFYLTRYRDIILGREEVIHHDFGPRPQAYARRRAATRSATWESTNSRRDRVRSVAASSTSTRVAFPARKASRRTR